LFIIILTIRLAEGKGEDTSDYNMSKIHWNIDLLANIPTLILSYSFQSAFFPAYNSLKQKNDRNGMKATFGAFTICFVIYVSIIVVSMLTYGDKIEENILTNVGESSDVLSILLQIIFLIISAMHIPMVYFIGKENVLIIFDEIARKSYSSGHGLRRSLSHADETPTVDFNEDNHNAYLSMNPYLYYSISIGLFVLIVFLSIVVKSLVFLLGIIGSTGTTFIVFIAPGVFYIKSYHMLKASRRASDKQRIPRSRINYFLAWVMVAKGFGFMVVLNFATIYVAIKG
jgi:amino acid permease